MKKVFTVIFCLFSTFSFCQTRVEGSPIIEYVSKKINQHITFLSYEEKKDSIRVRGIQYYCFKKKTYVDMEQAEIKKLYPELTSWFTIDVNLPLRSTNRAHVDDF